MQEKVQNVSDIMMQTETKSVQVGQYQNMKLLERVERKCILTKDIKKGGVVLNWTTLCHEEVFKKSSLKTEWKKIA